VIYEVVNDMIQMIHWSSFTVFVDMEEK